MKTLFAHRAARLGLLVSVSVCLSRPAARAGTLLLTAQGFSVLGASAVTNTGPSTISGDLGVYARSAVSWFPPDVVGQGAIHPNHGKQLDRHGDQRQCQRRHLLAVGSSAALGTNTTFAGNILALSSVTLNTGAKIECGRAFAQTGAVTPDSNVISINCAAIDFGSEGFSPVSSLILVPESGGALLLGIGLLGIVVKRSAPTKEGDAHAS